ncbi:SAM-dependent methyltransferase [Sphaerisporangium sp. TRM90804]|uniref:SAM-dependent methyltransferase n=1 Tax=Sphaerisporangium sp. TRM90804 TaxID=3031113 RepID=UPI00244792B5|nr:SAM-dependent methyltransferase [Sphaerisporangium sp. TRM90804]MDH2428085.1 SAM-dependent methyltransferase [Sphaerisporangium sp. TRM90804]
MSRESPDGFDPTTPNSARIYDYMLGGKDNFAPDRAAAEQIMKAFPEARQAVRYNRVFLVNAVRYMAAEEGIQQFVDIGAGLPTQPNVHEVARAVHPLARTVYVDNDPVVCVHGRALLANTATVAMIHGDLRKPEDLHDQISRTGLIDWDQPVGMLMVAVLHYLAEPEEHLNRLRAMMAPGSHLAISHLSSVEERTPSANRLKEIYAKTSTPLVPRTPEEVDVFFGDFERVDPDRYATEDVLPTYSRLGFGAVARKP